MLSIKTKIPLDKKFVLGVLIFTTLLVLASVFSWFYFQPEKIAKRELEYITKDYYETYYYPDLIKETDKSTLVNFTEKGLPTVKLRQLLLFDKQRHADSIKAFNQNKYFCDTDGTYVRYYPVEPFEKTDYRVEYFYSCNSL